MDIVGQRAFLDVGIDVDLPPLLVHECSDGTMAGKVLHLACSLIEEADLIPPLSLDALVPEADVERRKLDLAVNLATQYYRLLSFWTWGDSVIEWIRQCEITFEQRQELRHLLRPDVWPHAGRSSFVTLLEDKRAPTPAPLTEAVGLRLIFTHKPPIDLLSDQFLFLLNSPVAAAAYRKWAAMSPTPLSALPPERFHFEIMNMQWPNVTQVV